MAENENGQERSEEASSKRKEDARKKGQITRSRDFGAMVLTLGGVLLLFVVGSRVAGVVFLETRRLFEAAGSLETDMVVILGSSVGNAGMATLLFLCGASLLGILAGSVPGGVTFSASPLAFKGSRLSPLAGFKRMFSVKALVEAAKAILKFLLVAGSTVLVIQMSWDYLPELGRIEANAAIPIALGYLKWACLGVTLPLLLISLIDVPFQIHEQKKQLKMTKQEVKEEMKDTDGRPEVKQRIRALQQEIAQSRMFSDIEDADVIITNPQHYAVGLKYDPVLGDAPIIIAKGADLIAARIREVAQTHSVPIVRSPMLCRALFYNCDIGGKVPVPLFVAVAQVLAYVQRLRLAKSGMAAMPEELKAADVPPEYRSEGDV